MAGAKPTAADSASMREISEPMSAPLGTPRLLSALETRSSKIDSSLSQCWPALTPTSPAMPVILLATALNFCSARLCVFFCSVMPSFTRLSNTLEPSPCALLKAARPAAQICCAESRTLAATWWSSSAAGLKPTDGAAFFAGVFFCSFFTIVNLQELGAAIHSDEPRHYRQGLSR